MRRFNAEGRGSREVEHDSRGRCIFRAQPHPYTPDHAAGAFDGLGAAQKARQALGDAIKANETAVAGVKREALSGSRTTLDILDAESELRDSRIAYQNAVHDEYIAKFTLLGGIGTATASDFNLEVVPYNPDDHYNAVEGRWIGTRP